MKFFLILFYLSTVNGNEKRDRLTDAASKALIQSSLSSVNIIYNVEDSIEDFIKTLNIKLSIKIESIEMFETVERGRRTSSIILLKNLPSFINILDPKISHENFHVNGKIFIVIYEENLTYLQMTAIFDVFWRKKISNVNLIAIMGEEQEIKMFTFFPFSEENCENLKPKIINRFSTFSWQNSDFFINKLKNLNKCPLKLLTYENKPMTVIENDENISGYEVEMVKLIAKTLNSTLQIEELKGTTPWGFILPNGTSGGIMKRAIEGETDFAIGGLYLTFTRAKFMDFCIYSYEKIVLTIPQGIPLNTFEKLFSPYAYLTWIALSFTLFGAIVFIFIMKRQKKPIQDFIFGVNTGNSYLNFLEIILSGSQVRSPRNNFARTLLTIFVLFCIIMRTVYQSGLFQFLQSDQRHPQVQTIDELVEKKFDVFMYESFNELSRGLKIEERQKFVGNRSIEYYMLQTLNPRNRLATVGPLVEVTFSNQLNYKNFTFKILPEILFSIPLALYFPRNHFLVGEIDTRIHEIETAGFQNFYPSKYLRVVKQQISLSPKKLNMSHLLSGFIIYLGGCILAGIVLVIEIIIHRFSNKTLI